MLISKKRAPLAVAAIGATVLLLASGCATDSGSGGEGEASGPLKIGSLLPQTGALAFLGPPEIAGVNLAIKEINDTGGVNGADAEVLHRDSGDTTTDLATQSTTELLNEDVAAVVGAASSGVSQTVINQITGAGVIQISPANTSEVFTEWDDKNFYWRTAPSDVLQGRVLGNYMVSQGAQSVGLIVLNDAYGTGLAKSIRASVEAGGGEIVSETMFNEGDSQFTSQVDEVVGAKPDAIALVTFDQAKSIVPLLTARDVKPEQMYFVDGNLADYSKDLDPGTLEGAAGTQPGVFANDDLKKRLAEVDDGLDTYNYASESYDATALVALGAIAAESNDPAAIRDQLKAISEGGTKCNQFTECRKLLEEDPKADIDYDGYSGPIGFSDKGDVTEATIGVYKFDKNNAPQPDSEEAGKL